MGEVVLLCDCDVPLIFSNSTIMAGDKGIDQWLDVEVTYDRSQPETTIGFKGREEAFVLKNPEAIQTVVQELIHEALDHRVLLNVEAGKSCFWKDGC